LLAQQNGSGNSTITSLSAQIRLNKALSVAELLATDSGIGIGIGIGGSTQHPGSQPTSWQGFPRVSAHELCRLSTANICRRKPSFSSPPVIR